MTLSLPPFVLVDRRRSNLYTGFCRGETCHQHLFTIISFSLKVAGQHICSSTARAERSLLETLLFLYLLKKGRACYMSLFTWDFFVHRAVLGPTTMCFSSLCHSGTYSCELRSRWKCLCVYMERAASGLCLRGS